MEGLERNQLCVYRDNKYPSWNHGCMFCELDFCKSCYFTIFHIDGLMQKKRNSSVLAKDLRFFCIKPSIYA